MRGIIIRSAYGFIIIALCVFLMSCAQTKPALKENLKKNVQVGEDKERVWVQVYARLGTINPREGEEGSDGYRTGHKFLRGLGVKFSSNPYKKLQFSLGGEFWEMGEPLDDENHIPIGGKTVYGNVIYNWKFGRFTIGPFLSLGFEKWEREYPGNWGWTSVDFLKITPGIKIEYKLNNDWSLYAKGGPVIPFSARTNDGLNPSGRPGFDTEVGIRWVYFSLGFFYNRIELDNSSFGSIQHPEFKFNRYYGIFKWTLFAF